MSTTSSRDIDDTHVLAAITDAQSINEVWDLYAEFVGQFGFDRLIFGYSRFSHERNLGELADAVILTRHDDDYVDLFINKEFFRKGPMMRWAVSNTGACSWSLLAETFDELDDEEKEMVALNMQHEVVAGYTLSFDDGTLRYRAALALTARRGLSQGDVDKIWDDHGERIQLVSKIMRMKIAQLPNMNMRKSLTARQTQVLEWTAQGKSLADTATIMGLSLATVEKHLRLARAAVGADTTAQAILKANLQNQFFIVDYE